VGANLWFISGRWNFAEGMEPFANCLGSGKYESSTPTGGPLTYTGKLYFK
jgi:hypothetical protein